MPAINGCFTWTVDFDQLAGAKKTSVGWNHLWVCFEKMLRLSYFSVEVINTNPFVTVT